MKTKTMSASLVGFVAGVLAGFIYGQKAKSNLSQAVTTDVSGGVVTVQLDTLKAARGGLPSLLDKIL